MANLRNFEGLQSNSKKKILFDCDVCGIEVEQAYCNYMNQPGELKLCRSCRNKNTASRKDIKEKMSIAAKNNWNKDEYRNKTTKSLSNALKESWANRTNRTPSNKSSWSDILSLFKRFENMGFILITTEEDWNTKASKIHCKCEYGHEHQYTIAQLKNVKSCHQCKLTASNNKKSLKVSKQEKADVLFEKIQSFYNKYEVTKIDYDGTRDSKLLFKCKDGHEFEYNNWHRKMNSSEILDTEICPECFRIYQFNKLKEEMSKENYELVELYKHENKNDAIYYICSNGHKEHMFISNWIAGQRCMKCFLQTSASKKEQDLADFIKNTFDVNIEQHNRTILNGKEIDIYIPSKRLGIEFNGKYWHSTAKVNDIYYHRDKVLNSRKKNIKLIQIDEGHWENNQNVIKSILSYHLNQINTIHASKCELIETSYESSLNFYNENSYMLPKYSESKFYSFIFDKKVFGIIEYNNKSIISFSFKNDYYINEWSKEAVKKLDISSFIIDLMYWNEDILNIDISDTVILEPEYKTYDKYKIWDSGKLKCVISNKNKIKCNNFLNRNIDSINILESNVIKLYNNLLNKKGNYLSTQMYSDIILYFQWKEFYKNELEKWKDYKFREKLYNNRLKYANKRPEELTNRSILAGMKIAGICKTFSHFSPLWLKAFIEEFNIKSIYDPCGGWGHRMIATGNLKYIYNDINLTTFNNVISMSKYLHLENKRFYNEDAAYIELNDTVDCMFTCPPYLDTEIYTDKGAENLSRNDFIKWWEKVVKNALNICSKYIAFVVSNSVPDEIKFDIPNNLNLNFIREQDLGIKFNHFQRTSNNVKKKESLFIYRVN